jgi:flavin reductase (DIM6/NTAB) family NADH-FMN oxidoreductase RutF
MYVEVPIEHLQINPFTAIGGDKILITAGTPDNFNFMTASWGAMGVLWERNTVTVYVRTSRHTRTFLEASEGFTISFLPPEMKDVLIWCGEHSGRAVDKLKESGLKPTFIPAPSGGERVAFKQATLIFSCTKAAAVPLNADVFLLDGIKDFYQGGDYHTQYIGFVDSILTNQ